MKFFTGRSAREPEIVVVETAHASLSSPNWLERCDVEGADLALAPVEPPEGPVPALVLTSVASTAPLTDAAVGALHAARTRHPDAFIVAVDLWHPAPDGTAPRGRRIVFVSRTEDGQDVVVATWVWATGTHHVQLSASCVPSQWTGYSPAFSGIAAQLSLTADPDDVAAAAVGAGDAPLDASVSARAGYPLEALDALPAPRFFSAAPRVSTAALQTLLSGATRSRMGAAYGVLPRAHRGSALARELQDAGWIDADGRLTRDGGAAGVALAARQHLLTVQTRRGERAALLTAYAGSRGVLVLHDPAMSEGGAARGADGAVRHATVVDPEHLPVFVSAWLGLTPGWPVSEVDEGITVDELRTHLEATDDAVEPWTDVLLRTGRGELYDVISHSRGWLRIGAPVDGIHPLRAEPTASVFDVLAAVISRARA